MISNVIQKLSLESEQTTDNPSWQALMEDPLSVKARLCLIDMEITQADRSVIWKALCQPSLKVQESFSSLQSGSFDAIIDKNHGSNPLLARILKAYSAYDPEVGYQSSLASVVTPLLAIGVSNISLILVIIHFN